MVFIPDGDPCFQFFDLRGRECFYFIRIDPQGKRDPIFPQCQISPVCSEDQSQG